MKTKKTKKADLEGKRSLFLSIGLVLSLSFVLLAFSWKTPVNQTDAFDQVDWGVPDDIVIPLTRPEKKEVLPPVQTVVEFTLVDNQTEIEDEHLEIFNSEITDEGIDVDALLANRKDDAYEDKTVIYNFVDEMPEFPGGKQALLNYIGKTVNYPVIAQENGIQGKVYVNFVVNADGQVGNVSVVRPVDPSLDKEAIRVVESMPRWKPGKQAGRAVRVFYHVPISFVLQ
ncbi:energy transducer TonB [uncultured Sunxiuqinia sp.]|uniref:energy transducer TonB n=1 Tax=uncultured Sunxiuqinia sp. TaxID=1573825 RepID=UPI00260E9C0F|nr:energy transducer TonB [uncultured Sunxiuqinia sp.]